jgi:hypothetical protein
MPPTTMPSSLQSNWKASPSSNFKGTKALMFFARIGAPGTDVVGDAGVATGIAAGLDLCKQCACRASVFFGSQGIGFECLLQFAHMPTEFAKHSLAAVGRLLLTSSGALSQLRTVLRDNPVRLAISCNDSLSRRCIRRILPNISMVITLFVPCLKIRQGK